MHRVLVASATLAFTLSSYAWAAGPEDVLGQALPKASMRAPKVASPARAGAASGAGLNARRYAKALDGLAPEGQAAVRGAADTRVYKAASPSVVLVVSDNSLGSGALVSADGKIVTNLHVVGEAQEVGVIFKPATEGAKVGEKDVRVAKVIRRDGVADLALLQVAEVPAGVTPLKLAGESPLDVGADVHAIGHPTGEAWTYTRGIVSQVRQDYAWKAEDRIQHKATVIQTQTPINPGNSGGPLLNDALEIVGINSFSGEGEGMNFAVSAKDVSALLTLAADRAVEAPKACEVQEISTEPSKDPKGENVFLDTDCDGEADVLMTIPARKKDPITYMSDEDGDGKIDTVLFDFGQDGQLDFAAFDTDGDGKHDLEGFYRKGENEPYRMEKVKAKN
jgi:S1-C subfamily serine protease